MLVAVMKLLREMSLKEMYRGMSPKLLQTILNNAFLMLTYEFMRKLIAIMIVKLMRVSKV